MTFAVSPSVTVREIDLTTVVPAVSTTEGALAGVFRWGPVEKRILVDSGIKLVQRFGEPSNFNPETWFTAANFLDYGNRLYISRAADTTGNTQDKEFIGNSTNFTWEGGNNVLLLDSGAGEANGDGLEAGMHLSFSNSALIPSNAFIVSVNTTAAVMTDSPSANIEGATYVFREDITFTAAALQSDLNYDISDVGDWDEQIIKNDDH